jgi:hypothetical protein
MRNRMKFKETLCEIGMFIIMFFAPVKAAIITVIVLGLFDFITGVSASVKQDIPITSRKMYSSVVKVTMYSLLILASHMIEVHLIDYLPLVKMATSTIALVELKSLYENISIVLGLDLWNVVKEQMNKRPSK